MAAIQFLLLLRSNTFIASQEPKTTLLEHIMYIARSAGIDQIRLGAREKLFSLCPPPIPLILGQSPLLQGWELGVEETEKVALVYSAVTGKDWVQKMKKIRGHNL